MVWMTSKIDTPNIRILLKDSVPEEDVLIYEEILNKYRCDVLTLRDNVISHLRTIVKDGIVLK